MKLALGKLPPETLERLVLRAGGRESKELLVGPGIGADFAAIKMGKSFLIVSSDPVTGVTRRVGWHAVCSSANDVATSGNRPQFMQSVILLPEDSSERTVKEIASEINESAIRLGISVAGGHTEVTPGLRRTIVVTTAFASVRSFVTSAGSKMGDRLMLTKSAGIEGTAILGSERERFSGKVDARTGRQAKRFYERMSVITDAETAFRTGFVHAMHDCTEGGVLGAAYEMSVASKLGFRIEEKRVPVAPETLRICSALQVDPMKLIGSGSLLLAVQPGKEAVVRKSLAERGVAATVIGKFSGDARVVLHEDESEEAVDAAPLDELWRLLA